MKKIFVVSQVLLIINIFILIVPTSIFLFIFKIFPNLDSSENGLGVYPLICMIWGIAGLLITIPFALIMFLLYMWYKYKFSENNQ